MFYTHAILTKRGPLARLWLAAHWDKKLTKAQIFETDIRLSCESILEPCLKLALRTKGHLLLGVVRIYSRKTKYLLADCNEAFIKIKMAFRPGIVGVEGTTNSHGNVDAETREVSIAAITLPDNFHDFDLIDLNIDYIDDPMRFQVHQARAEEITLKEDFISVPMPMDDDFGDVNVLDEPEFFRNLQTSGRANGQTSNLRLNNTSLRQDHSLARPLSDDPFALDGFGDLAAPASVSEIGADQYDHVMSPFHQEDQPVPTTVEQIEPEQRMDVDLPHIPGADETTLLSNVSDEFVLPPILTTGQTPAATRQAAAKRKRKLIIDEMKEIDSSAMKIQLSDTTDIVGVLELAPPTRRLMYLKETGGVDKLFSSSSSTIYSKTLQQIINRHLITKALEQMPPDNAQSQHDEAIERDESSLDQMRAAAHSYFDVALSPNVSSRKRVLSGNDQSNLDKRPRFDSMPPPPPPPPPPLPDDSMFFPPITPMDNFMDDVSPTRRSARKTVQDVPSSPTRTPKRKKISEDEQNEEDDEQGQTTTTTQEDFESGKKLNRRGKIMLNAFERAFDSTDAISFHDHLSSGNPNYHTRKLTAQKFYTLLVLKKLQAVDVEQNQPFSDITVTPGVNFHQFITSNGR